MRKWKHPQHPVHPFTFLNNTKHKDTQTQNIFRVKTNNIENQYDIYSITCADRLSIIEGVYFTVSYAPVAGTRSFRITTEIEYSEGLIIFVLYISNSFQNIISPKPS